MDTVLDIFAANSCNPNDADGFGNHVKVLVPVVNTTLTYAHLESASVAQGARILQGDQVGIEGKTGNTHDSEPPNNCGTHLHFQFDPTLPSDIDGQDVSPPTPGGPSTNSVVGAFNAPGAAIRELYKNLGVFFSSTSWGVVGWTADRTGTQEGCGSVEFCRLYVQYYRSPISGHWGSMQDFRLHGPPGDRFTSIMAGRWTSCTEPEVPPNYVCNGNVDAYWVLKPFFAVWLLNEAQVPATKSISLAITGQIGTGGNCRASAGCVAYQRFHLGYTWEHQTQGVQTAVYCPDIEPYYPNQNDVVTIDDVFAVAERFGASDEDAGLEPFEAWAFSWYDINGTGAVTIDDIFDVSEGFGLICHP